MHGHAAYRTCGCVSFNVGTTNLRKMSTEKQRQMDGEPTRYPFQVLAASPSLPQSQRWPRGLHVAVVAHEHRGDEREDGEEDELAAERARETACGASAHMYADESLAGSSAGYKAISTTNAEA